jgi:hypothetical protein
MLKLGKSKPWPFALEKMTGSKEMSATPIKECFQPLQEWLVKERCSKRYKIGWPGEPAYGVNHCDTLYDIYYTKYSQRWKQFHNQIGVKHRY